MTAYANLLSTIPMPQQQWQTKTDVPPVASIKVSDAVDTNSEVSTSSRSNGFFENLKQKFIEKRMKKLESIPPEKRTPVQQAEIEANHKALNINA